MESVHRTRRGHTLILLRAGPFGDGFCVTKTSTDRNCHRRRARAHIRYATGNDSRAPKRPETVHDQITSTSDTTRRCATSARCSNRHARTAPATAHAALDVLAEPPATERVAEDVPQPPWSTMESAGVNQLTGCASTSSSAPPTPSAPSGPPRRGRSPGRRRSPPVTAARRPPTRRTTPHRRPPARGWSSRGTAWSDHRPRWGTGRHRKCHIGSLSFRQTRNRLRAGRFGRSGRLTAARRLPSRVPSIPEGARTRLPSSTSGPPLRSPWLKK